MVGGGATEASGISSPDSSLELHNSFLSLYRHFYGALNPSSCSLTAPSRPVQMSTLPATLRARGPPSPFLSVAALSEPAPRHHTSPPPSRTQRGACNRVSIHASMPVPTPTAAVRAGAGGTPGLHPHLCGGDKSSVLHVETSSMSVCLAHRRSSVSRRRWKLGLGFPSRGGTFLHCPPDLLPSLCLTPQSGCRAGFALCHHASPGVLSSPLLSPESSLGHAHLHPCGLSCALCLPLDSCPHTQPSP